MAAKSVFDFSILRELRKQHGLTMDEVSTRSGVSVAVISKLERNQSRAELETIYKLSRVFELSAADLLALAESPFAHRERETNYRSDGFQFRRISYANAIVLQGEAPAGAHVKRPEVHHDDYEVCWVTKGRLRLQLPHETYELEAGESLQFDAVLEHTYEALEDSALIIIHLRKEKRY
ncbi:MAG: helix-turn-helix domain-containing protein [Verrucomicrobiota bacterium JB022]|nr:helix-turn-helix domain-containing protein [Verrucomicrobiota bacterium JB022]